MARNLRPEYIRKLIKMELPNGYKFDLANYLHNPSYSYEYPSFCKTISEDEETITQRRVYYFKHYDGTGEYMEQVATFGKTRENHWLIASKSRETVLENGNRFNLKRLIAFI